MSTVNQNISASPAVRVNAIDALRALTVVLMIFVNDLWSLTDIPAWLEHAPHGVDGMGLADTVFPAFLFIVGMSLPFAIDHRRTKGDSDLQLIIHALNRSIALLVMGVFLVNGETINPEATGVSAILWDVLCSTAFILIWNSYPATLPKVLPRGLKALGIVSLLGLAFVYRGGEAGHLVHFGPQWWGILGLIGWAYLVAALVVIAARGRLSILIAAWAAFSALSLFYAAKLVPPPLHLIPEPIIDGTMTALSLGGVVTARLFQLFQRKDQTLRMTIVFAVIAAVLIGLSLWTRPYWGLSKLAATPAWLFLCSALTLLAFLAIYWLSDIAGKHHCFNPIRAAGTDTLLCYLMPLFLYALMDLIGLDLPAALLTGGPGLIKSLIFALLCVWATAALRHLGVRLKL
jgi:heparan-alpha-glucosaminide N-acetyltransferase